MTTNRSNPGCTSAGQPLPSTTSLTRFAAIRACMSVLLLVHAPSVPAQADAFPSKSTRLLVPCPSGGISDVLARALGARLTVQPGRPLLIDNRPGAGTTIAAAMTSAAAPDG